MRWLQVAFFWKGTAVISMEGNQTKMVLSCAFLKITAKCLCNCHGRWAIPQCFLNTKHSKSKFEVTDHEDTAASFVSIGGPGLHSTCKLTTH